MKKKILYTCIVSGIIAALTGICLLVIKDNETSPEQKDVKVTVKKQQQTIKQQSSSEEVETKNEKNKLTVYSQYELPIDSINEITKLPEEARKEVDKILNSSQGAYFIKYNPETKETVMLLQNMGNQKDKFTRHNLQMAQISESGKLKISELGYAGTVGETSNTVEQNGDVWEFDETVEPPRPLAHTALDERGKVLYTETWNYSEDEPIKYEMKNKKGKPISVLKEIQSGDSDFVKEHVFYNDNGKTSMSVSASYEGANLKHFSFYEDSPKDESIIIESEYTEGVKTQENIYNKNFEKIKSVKPVYNDFELSSIEVIDNHAENSLKEED